MAEPTGVPPSRRLAAGRALAVLSIVSAALAAWALFTGGFRVHLFGLPLSVRGAERPVLVAAICGLLAFRLLNLSQSRTVRAIARPRPWLAPAAAGLIVLGVLVTGFLFGARAAGGSDASGYVSQAAQWLTGSPRIAVPLAPTLPWPDAVLSLAPLGYSTSGAQTIVPTYSPGLPLLMAAAMMLLGACGPYVVGPLSAALLAGATYAIGARLSSRSVGLVAALCVATSPTVVLMMLQPMSDVPAAAAWTLSLLFALRARGPWHAAMAGIAAGVAIAIRPNLAPLAAAPALLAAVANGARPWMRGAARALAFGGGCLPFILLIGFIFNDLYGSPLRSGYGSFSDSYWLAHALPNLQRYPRWLFESQGVLAFAFLLAPVAALLRPSPLPRLVCFAFVLATLGAYVLYLPFDDWWYLRFLLPAFPLVFVLGADAIGTLAGRAGATARGLALALFAAVMTTTAVNAGERYHVLSIAEQEQRYVDAGAFVARTLPPDAILITMQHSGSARYYSGRETLRYDNMPADWLDRALEHFARTGRPVYALLESWEVPIFSERFQSQRGVELVRRQPLAATPDGRVLLFGSGADESGRGAPAMMPRAHGCVEPARR